MAGRSAIRARRRRAGVRRIAGGAPRAPRPSSPSAPASRSGRGSGMDLAGQAGWIAGVAGASLAWPPVVRQSSAAPGRVVALLTSAAPSTASPRPGACMAVAEAADRITGAPLGEFQWSGTSPTPSSTCSALAGRGGRSGPWRRRGALHLSIQPGAAARSSRATMTQTAAPAVAMRGGACTVHGGRALVVGQAAASSSRSAPARRRSLPGPPRRAPVPVAPLLVRHADHRHLGHGQVRVQASSTSIDETFSPPEMITSFSVRDGQVGRPRSCRRRRCGTSRPPGRRRRLGLVPVPLGTVQPGQHLAQSLLAMRDPQGAAPPPAPGLGPGRRDRVRHSAAPVHSRAGLGQAIDLDRLRPARSPPLR